MTDVDLKILPKKPTSQGTEPWATSRALCSTTHSPLDQKGHLLPLVFGLALGFALLLLPLIARAQDLSAQAGGPLMIVRAETGDSSPLPLIGEEIRISIDQGHARAHFAHTFQNETRDSIEGQYRIDLGTVARATGFAYYVGEQKIVGEIFEKDVAAEIYQQVTGTGRDPGLLEQTGEGVFSFRVAPILPAEKKRVEVTTSQILRQANDTLEMQIPLGRSGQGTVIELSDSRKVGKIWSSTHALRIERTKRGAKVRVGAPSGKPKKFVLRYVVEEADFHLSTAVHRTRGQDAYVYLSLASPRLLQQKKTLRDVTLVVDRSGSMSGEPLEAARRATMGVLQRLGDDDAVNVLVFDDGVDALYDAPRRVKDVRADALTFVQSMQSGGGTDLALALTEATKRQNASGRPQIVLFLTDGQSDPRAALEAAARAPREMRLYSVGIGAGVDRPLLSKLARENRGRFTYVADESNLERDVDHLYSRIETPVLSDIDLHVEGAQMKRLYPRRAPDLFQKDQLTFALRVAPDAGKTRATIVVTARQDGKKRTFQKAIDLRPTSRSWVGRQWGSSRVDDLLEQIALNGETPELKRETVELALAYDLVTPYTSFLAIPASEVTDAVRGTLEQERARRQAILQKHKDAAALSRTLMPPGDPVLTVRAPRTARGVTAVFPFGLTLDLDYQPDREVWEARFLVPNAVADGPYDVEIFVSDRNGNVTQTTTRYEIDSQAPAFSAHTTVEVGGVRIVVEGDEALREVRVTHLASKKTLRMSGITCKSSGCDLEREEAARFAALLELPPGTHKLRIVVTDLARNESVQEIVVVVPDDDGGC